MNFSKRLWRSLLFIMLISALCGGLAMPMLARARAAPPMQATATACGGTTITQWTFTGVTTPSTGSGTLSAAGLSGPNFNPGPSGGTDQAVTYGSWTTATSFDSTEYVEFIVPTLGRNAIGFSFDYRTTPAGPQTLELRYFDGTTFVPFGPPITLTPTPSGNTFYPLAFDLSTITALDNNPNAAFRLFGYSAGGGNLRLDNVTITGNCMAPAELTGTAADITATAASNQTGTAAVNLTGSAAPTSTKTLTSTPIGFRSVIINEVAWAGTVARSSDEWIELRNTTNADIDLSGWVLRSGDGSPNIALSGIIPRQRVFLLATSANAFTNVTPDLTYSGTLNNSGEVLTLFGPGGVQVDTANQDGGKWPAGLGSPTYASMERRSKDADNAINWFTFAGTPVARDRDNNLVRGTPGDPNWSLSVTATPSLTPTRTRTATARFTPSRTPLPLPPPQLIAINEFVPRPGHDWNNDGVVNVEDEYVELINHGTIVVNLSGYSLDDEVNLGSTPYRLPAITISPGERIVFYGSDTNLLLSDGGDGVRLLRPNGQLMDAYNYTVVRFPDQSYCRLPDDGGADDWNTNCYPTPGLRNALSGSFVSPPNVVDVDLLCPIADTLPLDFILAECPPFGNNIWRPAYWDDGGWYGEKNLPKSPGKWPVFVD